MLAKREDTEGEVFSTSACDRRGPKSNRTKSQDGHDSESSLLQSRVSSLRSLCDKEGEQ